MSRGKGLLLLFALLVTLKLGSGGGENNKTRVKRGSNNYERPWERSCKKPKPASRGGCGLTCVAGNWLDTTCSSIAPTVHYLICQRQTLLVSGFRREYIESVSSCLTEGGSQIPFVHNHFLDECVPKDWTCPEGNWNCQDPCLYSCDSSFEDFSICKVLNRKTGEVGRCGLQKSGRDYSIGCWDTPDECLSCKDEGYAAEPCWHWDVDECPRVPKKRRDGRLPSIYNTIEYDYTNYLYDYTNYLEYSYEEDPDEDGDGELFEPDYY